MHQLISSLFDVMIAKSYIESNLRRMNSKFNQSRSSKEELFFAKMAIIELCGWIEESMDDILLRCSIRNLKETENRDFFKEKIVEKTYGFHYTKHFRRMMTTLIGLIMYEKFEKSLDQVKFQRLKSELGNLTQRRNEEAHTHIKLTRTINAPSVTLRQFEAIYVGLVDIEHKLKLMNHLK